MEIEREFSENSKLRINFVKNLTKGSRVHISGICGTGTGSILVLLKSLGFYVSGSDKAFYPPMGEVVRQYADKVYEGYSSSNLESKPDLVVIGNALSRNNPESEYVFENKIPFCSMPELLSALLIGDHEDVGTSVVVSGTHGKTTTTSLIASILTSAGLEPGYFIGGVPTGEVLTTSIKTAGLNIKPQDRVVVLEGDEYDSAWFSKYSKFHSYRPDVLVITNIDFDHGDIFNTIEDIKLEFSKLIKRLPSSGLVVCCTDHENVRDVVDNAISQMSTPPKIISYGETNNPSLLLQNRSFKRSTSNSKFSEAIQEIEILYNNKKIILETTLTGKHNALNIIAAYAVASHLGITESEVNKALLKFSPIKRRQQKIFESKDYILIEDFAHHPEEVKTTISGIKESYSPKRLLAIFEPRSNTSRKAFFLEQYKQAFLDADVVFIKEVDLASSGYQGLAKDVEALNVEELKQSLVSLGKIVYTSSSVLELEKMITNEITSGDLLLVMSNGDFGGLPKNLSTILHNK